MVKQENRDRPKLHAHMRPPFATYQCLMREKCLSWLDMSYPEMSLQIKTVNIE